MDKYDIFVRILISLVVIVILIKFTNVIFQQGNDEKIQTYEKLYIYKDSILVDSLYREIE